MRATRPSPRTRATTHTIHSLWCTPQPRRSLLSRRFWLCQFIFGLLLSRGVTLVQLVCCFVVRSSSSARGCSGARRLFQVVMVAAGSAWGLALSHAGIPVHVWRCRRPSPYGGLDPLRRETSAATVAIHASGGRCSTRPCAHAVGPSSCSDPVRQQVWLDVQSAYTPRGRTAASATAPSRAGPPSCCSPSPRSTERCAPAARGAAGGGRSLEFGGRVWFSSMTLQGN